MESVWSALDAWDKALFLALNGLYNTFWDGFMAVCTDKWVWLPLYLLLIFLVIRRYGRQSVPVLLAVVLVIVLCDQWTSGFCKPFFARFRPGHCPALEGLVHLPIGRGDSYGFMSSHAANTVGLTVITACLFRSRPYTCLMAAWVLLNMYSRLYLGMHYPLDLLCGAVSGAVFGLLGYGLLQIIFTQCTSWFPASPRSRNPMSVWEWGSVAVLLAVTLLFSALYAGWMY
ncbi:MAG: phosphatase PAP2 family protein [Paludibacteraceae bacterium]|nr:phosphatase PAP2 family protein [Paludibacteraceae bacterium]